MFDDFNKDTLNKEYWLECYLPQWSCKDKTKPSYRINNSILTLYIANDQEPWSKEYNGNIRVSNLQTGVFSGPVGSSIGQHHFSKQLIVKEEQSPKFLVTPFYGQVEFKCRCNISKENVAALWMIGTEVNKNESSELCLFELKGFNIKKGKSVIGYGIRKFADPLLSDEFYEESFSIDVSKWNVFSLDWKKDCVDFYINGKHIKTISQSPNYRMQLMLNLYDLENIKNEDNTFDIDYVKVIDSSENRK